MIYCKDYLDKNVITKDDGTMIPAVYLELYCDEESELDKDGGNYIINKNDIVNYPASYNPNNSYIIAGSLLIILDSKKGCFSNSEEQFIPFN